MSAPLLPVSVLGPHWEMASSWRPVGAGGSGVAVLGGGRCWIVQTLWAVSNIRSETKDIGLGSPGANLFHYLWEVILTGGFQSHPRVSGCARRLLRLGHDQRRAGVCLWLRSAAQ